MMFKRIFLILTLLILMAGVSFSSPGYLDSTFGDGGVVTYNGGGNDWDSGNAVAIQPDGKIVVAGYCGGLEIPLLSPFDNTRYFFPWTPIVVSPIGIGSFFSQWGLTVIKNELLWIWLPSFLIVVVSMIIRFLSERR